MKRTLLFPVLALPFLATACGGEGAAVDEPSAAAATEQVVAESSTSAPSDQTSATNTDADEAPIGALNMIVSDLDDEVTTWQDYWTSFDCESQFAYNENCVALIEKANRVSLLGANDLIEPVMEDEPGYLGEAPPEYRVLVDSYLNEAVQLEDYYEDWEAAACEYSPASCLQEAAGISVHMEKIAKALSRWEVG